MPHQPGDETGEQRRSKIVSPRVETDDRTAAAGVPKPERSERSSDAKAESPAQARWTENQESALAGRRFGGHGGPFLAVSGAWRIRPPDGSWWAPRPGGARPANPR